MVSRLDLARREVGAEQRERERGGESMLGKAESEGKRKGKKETTPQTVGLLEDREAGEGGWASLGWCRRQKSQEKQGCWPAWILKCGTD